MIYSLNAQYATACRASVLAFLLTTPHTSYGFEMSDSIELHSVIETEWAVESENNSSQKFELIFEPEADITINTDSSVYILGRLRVDKENSINPNDQNQSELRELYIDTRIGNTRFLIGKQQIVWGKSDGLKVLDVINPQEFREFILDEFDQSRIPLWSINAETQLNDIAVQFIWIPDQTYHEFSDGIYAFTSPTIIPQLPAGAQLITSSTTQPDNKLPDADWGVRLSTFWHGWDLTLNYLYHYEDTPVLFRTLNTTGSGLQIFLNPEYRRSHLFGGTFSNSFGDLTLRGELGYSTDQYISTIDPTDFDGVVKTNELSYVLGFDWFGITDTFLSFQLFQTYLDKNNPGMIQNDTTTRATLLLRNDYMNETLTAEILWLHDFDIDDGLVRPKLVYQVNDQINVSTGLDIFYGKKTGVFGQFNKTDRLVMNLTMAF
jgi:Protein of unknown function (DUF1302)